MYQKVWASTDYIVKIYAYLKVVKIYVGLYL